MIDSVLMKDQDMDLAWLEPLYRAWIWVVRLVLFYFVGLGPRARCWPLHCRWHIAPHAKKGIRRSWEIISG